MKLYNLKKARKEAGIKTQADFAEKLGVHEKTVMNWEQGRATPSLEDAAKIADTLNCSIDYLLGRIECKTHDAQTVHDFTGLSEKAIEKLHHWHEQADKEMLWNEYISIIIAVPEYEEFLSRLSEYMGFEKLKVAAENNVFSNLVDQAKLDIECKEKQDANLWQMSRIHSNIIESMTFAKRKEA